MAEVFIRPAEPLDGEALQRIDVATWTAAVSPAPPPAPSASFFESTTAEEVHVAEVDDQLVGYVQLGPVHSLESSAHVLELKALAVDPAWQRRGIGHQLVRAAIAAARRHGARRLVLRVLGSNTSARALYDRCGFRVEGVLREQFLLEAQYVDDVFMALDLDEARAGR